MGQVPDVLGRDARLPLCVLERVRLDFRPVGVEAAGRALDELAVLEAGGDDLAPQRVGKGYVAADIEAQPEVRPRRGRCPARVNGDEPGAAVDPPQEVVEEDRVGLARIAAPQEDEIRLLDLTV